MKNRILSAALALCLCLGLAVPALAAGPTFTDVPASHWAYDAIEDMSSRGVVAGFGNGRFGPGVNVTRLGSETRSPCWRARASWTTPRRLSKTMMRTASAHP